MARHVASPTNRQKKSVHGQDASAGFAANDPANEHPYDSASPHGVDKPPRAADESGNPERIGRDWCGREVLNPSQIRYMAPDAVIIVDPERADEVAAAFGMAEVERRVLGEWAAVVLERR